SGMIKALEHSAAAGHVDRGPLVEVSQLLPARRRPPISPRAGLALAMPHVSHGPPAFSELIRSMFWWFERNGEYLRLEVLEPQPGTFELRLIQADGLVTVETFSNADDLATRQAQLQSLMTDEGWSGPHGWVL